MSLTSSTIWGRYSEPTGGTETGHRKRRGVTTVYSRSGDAFAWLVVARVNTHLTIHRLQQDLQAANRRMKRDLDTAARVQQALLPERAPATNRADFAWAYRPCDELAGDSLNLFQLDDRRAPPLRGPFLRGPCPPEPDDPGRAE